MRHRYYGKIAGPGEPLGLVPGGPWVALEKIHGAQMQIAVAGEQVRFGKRKAWLADDDPFFGWQLVRAALSETARTAARRLGAPLVVFYGELFGGGYPHAEVAPVPGLQPVQTGIWYAPELRWAAFDALVAAGEDDEGELLGWSELAELARETEMLVPPVVRVGPRPHVEAAPTRAPTRVPALLGLPALADNFAEGLVVRPDARATGHAADVQAQDRRVRRAAVPGQRGVGPVAAARPRGPGGVGGAADEPGQGGQRGVEVGPSRSPGDPRRGRARRAHRPDRGVPRGPAGARRGRRGGHPRGGAGGRGAVDLMVERTCRIGHALSGMMERTCPAGHVLGVSGVRGAGRRGGRGRRRRRRAAR
ncbi:RNA ligase family protein [Nannocystis pusilla]|uniref:RNA ligase family protein n=1 Tax=Nannocystis pusilla TaxID=889268 RepID=UPI003B7D8858